MPHPERACEGEVDGVCGDMWALSGKSRRTSTCAVCSISSLVIASVAPVTAAVRTRSWRKAGRLTKFTLMLLGELW